MKILIFVIYYYTYRNGWSQFLLMMEFDCEQIVSTSFIVKSNFSASFAK